MGKDEFDIAVTLGRRLRSQTASSAVAAAFPRPSTSRFARGRRRIKEAENRTGRVGRELKGRRADTCLQLAAAGRIDRMRIDDCIAPIEFIKYRLEQGIAQPASAVTGEQADAINFEGVENVFDFLQCVVGVREREDGKQAEAAFEIRHNLRAVFVELARQSFSLGIAEIDPGCRHRQNSGLHTLFIHDFDIARGRPVPPLVKSNEVCVVS